MNDSIAAVPQTDHHDPAGGFRNPWPSSQPHGFGSVIKWMLSRKRSPDEPASAIPQQPLTAMPEPGVNDFAITWIGHSTFLIQCDGLTVLTDPIWSDRASPIRFAGPRRQTRPALPLERLSALDAVFISHDHYDHLDSLTVSRLARKFPGAMWAAPLGVGSFLRSHGVAHVEELDWWQSRSLGPISAVCTPAQHFSGRYPWNRDSTLWCGWVIHIGSRHFFFAGDTGLHPAFSQIAGRLGPFDAAILPIGAYEPRWFMQPVHMSPEDAVSAYSQLVRGTNGDCIFIPSHWGTFRLTDEPLTEPPRRLAQEWLRAGLPDKDLRILALGETLSP